MITRRDNCRLCKSYNVKLVFQLAPSALANQFVKDPNIVQDTYPLDLFECENCGHFQLLDIVDPEIMFKHYLYVSGTSTLMDNHFSKYATDVQKEYLTKGKLVVDIGSNDGTLLKHFKDLGCRVLGVDPAVNLAQKACQNNIPTLAEFFTQKLALDIVNHEGRADVITCNNCFAHTDNLDEIVLGVKKLLTDDGVFIFECSYFMDCLKVLGFDQIYHEHTSYHTVSPLISYFNSHNMSIIKVENINIHGGSIRVYVQNGIKPITIELQQYIDEEKDNSTLIKEFVYKIEEQKAILKARLAELKFQGKKIAAVAASAKSTTFLHYYDLDHTMIDFIADDAKEKIGLFSPGKHIPVFPFSAIYDQDPDYLLILSFNFTDFIIKKHQYYLGTWIAPLPIYTEI